MRYRALAADGDGTLTHDGRMEPATVDALERLRHANCLRFLVTGEATEELKDFPRIDLFDRIVAENGAVAFNPATRHQYVLAAGLPKRLLDALHEAAIDPLKLGTVVISTKTTQESRVRDIIEALKLDWQLIHNREDLILLPSHINKATGLATLLDEVHLSPREVAAIGDAENDRAMLEYCGLGVAVSNAVEELRRHATLVTKGSAGAGVVELVEKLLRNELP
jgi:hydroxymethylpyrimidine pyrophosphatase-like HAD family hydrolase